MGVHSHCFLSSEDRQAVRQRSLNFTLHRVHMEEFVLYIDDMHLLLRCSTSGKERCFSNRDISARRRAALSEQGQIRPSTT